MKISLKNFKLNSEGIFSITKPYESFQIIKTIEFLYQGNIKDLVITDGTASMGGDLINFSKKVKFVNGVEVNNENYEILKENCEFFECSNIKLYNDDYLKVYDKLEQDIIYLDPPWGGSSYKEKDFITLKLGNLEIWELINLIIQKKLCTYILIKAPLNVSLYGIDYDLIKVIYNKTKVPTFKIICINVVNKLNE